MFCVIVSLVLTTALYNYFKLAVDILSSPTGHLLFFVSPAMIKAANEAVRESTLTPISMGVVNSFH